MATFLELAESHDWRLHDVQGRLQLVRLSCNEDDVLDAIQQDFIPRMMALARAEFEKWAHRNRKAWGKWKQLRARLSQYEPAISPSDDHSADLSSLLQHVDDEVSLLRRELRALEHSIATAKSAAATPPAGQDLALLARRIDRLEAFGNSQRIDGIEAAVGLQQARIETIDIAIGNIARSLETLTSSVRKHAEDLGALDQRLQRHVAARAEWPERFKVVQRRVDAVLAKPGMAAPPAWLRLSAEELASRLRARGFVGGDALARDVLKALTKRLVVLRGAPGTGKSTLAMALAAAVLDGAEADVSSFVPMTPELSIEKAVGGRSITQDKRVGPALGFLTEAVVRCHERKAGFWLILDEFNRGNPDQLLTPLMHCIAAGEGAIEHPNLFPDRSEEAARIPIPPAFRIVATMNHLDRGLFELSSALTDRIAFVDLFPVEGGDERDVLLAAAWNPWRKSAPPQALARGERLLQQAASAILEASATIRRSARDGDDGAARSCTIGARPGIDALRELLDGCVDGRAPDAKQLSDRIDDAIARSFTSRVERYDADTLARIAADFESRNVHPRFVQSLRHAAHARWS